MDMFGYCVYFFCILGTVASASNASSPAFEDPLVDAVTRASSWVLSQRLEDSSWGPITPRVVVALEMASETAPLSPSERELLTKQLNILLSLELGEDLSTQRVPLSRLAHFVNAQIATCQNPRQFHGIDLVQSLRRRAESSPQHTALYPIVYLSLCLAGEAKRRDMNAVTDMFLNHTRIDMQAIDLMALTCIARQKWAASSYKSYADSFLKDFTSRFMQIHDTSDVYTMALAYQAIQSAGGSVNVSALSSRQLPSGSFGSLLASYHAIPALLGKSLLQIKCSRKVSHLSNPPLSPSGGIRVHYSLWVGERNNRDSHTVTVTVPSNATFLDVMRLAEEKNPSFRFQIQETVKGLSVYVLSGIPNDLELELYWTLFRQRDGASGGEKRNRTLTLIKGGLEKVFPSNEEHYVFWFKRRTCSLNDVASSQCEL